MKTINDVLHFLNKIDLIGYLKRDEYGKFSFLYKILTDEFQDENSETIIRMLNIVDNLHMLFVTQDLNNVWMLTDVLRNEIFLMVEEK